MSDKFSIASFNVENLFSRPKVFNFRNKSIGDDLLGKINEFQKILKKDTYTASDKARIVELYVDEKLKNYINVNEERGNKLFKKVNYKIVGVLAAGVGDWEGSIVFKRAKFSEMARGNTAKVIKKTKADVMCIVEVEDRPALKAFDGDVLNYRYGVEMLLDGNDNRGIDVGLYSRFPLGGIWTHMFDEKNNKRVFSRDCPEYEVLLPNGKNLYILCNHLKSKGYDPTGKADDRRRSQAEYVAELLGFYNLKKDWVVVAGDLNDYPTSGPLEPLMKVKDLYDVLELQHPDHPHRRWTYEYKKTFEQIDYVLVSKPLKNAFRKAGVERRGIYALNKMTSSSSAVETETEFSTVTHWTSAASDHGAVWAEFDL